MYAHVGMLTEPITMIELLEEGNEIAVLDRFLLCQPDCRRSTICSLWSFKMVILVALCI